MQLLPAETGETGTLTRARTARIDSRGRRVGY